LFRRKRPIPNIALVEPVGFSSHIAVMDPKTADLPPPPASTEDETRPASVPPKPREIGGPKGPEPTRYGDWEVGGRCTDF